MSKYAFVLMVLAFTFAPTEMRANAYYGDDPAVVGGNVIFAESYAEKEARISNRHGSRPCDLKCFERAWASGEFHRQLVKRKKK